MNKRFKNWVDAVVLGCGILYLIVTIAVPSSSKSGSFHGGPFLGLAFLAMLIGAYWLLAPKSK